MRDVRDFALDFFFFPPRFLERLFLFFDFFGRFLASLRRRLLRVVFLARIRCVFFTTATGGGEGGGDGGEGGGDGDGGEGGEEGGGGMGSNASSASSM